jgi:hypothetical protein
LIRFDHAVKRLSLNQIILWLTTFDWITIIKKWPQQMHAGGLAHAQDNIAPKNKQLKQPKVITQIRVKIPRVIVAAERKMRPNFPAAAWPNKNGCVDAHCPPPARGDQFWFEPVITRFRGSQAYINLQLDLRQIWITYK